MAGAFQDEQTGGHFPAMIERFVDNPRARFTLVNGTHAEALVTAEIFQRWTEFLDFYVAERIPEMPEAVRTLVGPTITDTIGLPAVPVPPDRFTDAASYEDALAEYEAEPRVRVLFESGGGDPVGGPQPRFEESLSRGLLRTPSHLLVPAARWRLGAGGAMVADDDDDGAADQIQYDPEAGQETTFDGETGDAFSRTSRGRRRRKAKWRPM